MCTELYVFVFKYVYCRRWNNFLLCKYNKNALDFLQNNNIINITARFHLCAFYYLCLSAVGLISRSHYVHDTNILMILFEKQK